MAIVVPNISDAFGFFGSFCVSGILFPMIIKVKISNQKWYEGQNLIICIANLILSSITTIALIVSGIKMIDHDFKFQ